jgi:hypothetical protein
MVTGIHMLLSGDLDIRQLQQWKKDDNMQTKERYILGKIHAIEPVDTSWLCWHLAVPLGSCGDKNPCVAFRGLDIGQLQQQKKNNSM